MKLCVLLVVCFMINVSNAQIRGVYSIGCIGNTDKGVKVFSGPVAIRNGSCLKVETGAAAFQAPRTGTFLDACLNDGNINYNGPQFGVFPNPFKNGVTVRQLVPVLIAGKILISVSGINGQLYKTMEAESAQLLAGYHLNLAYLSQGTYVLKVFFQHGSAAYKIIKTN
jgi:hypothetical protein